MVNTKIMIKTEDTSTQEIQVKPVVLPTDERVLTPDALAFLQALHQEFNQRRLDLLETRKKKQKEWDQGKLPDFLPETSYIRLQYRKPCKTGG
jgi:malate synthase